MTLLEGIAREEGFYEQGKRPQRNNNPGDLEYNSETIRFGATHGDPRFAVFPDVKTGWNALCNWLSVPAKFDKDGNLIGGYMGATIKQALFRFAPPDDHNDSESYVANVCAWTELQPTDVLTVELLRLPQ